jgi:hypothetical protein
MMILKMLISVMAIFLNSKPIMAASKILPAEVAFRPEVLLRDPSAAPCVSRVMSHLGSTLQRLECSVLKRGHISTLSGTHYSIPFLRLFWPEACHLWLLQDQVD